MPPITQSMTYPYKNFNEIPCPVYGRTRTPTNTLLEERLASLEGGEGCLTAASGSQALFNLIFTIARPGDNVVTSLNVFGEGYKQAATIFPERCQVDFRFVQDPADMQSWDALKLVVHAVTFGTSRTICMHPATITHEHMTPEERAAAGIDDGLIRLSVGLEDPQDIINDLDQALDF